MLPKCVAGTDVGVSGAFCLGSSQQEATPVPGGDSTPSSCRVVSTCVLQRLLVGLLLAIFPFLPLSALLVFFISLNSCLSASPSLGPRNTAIAMTTEAFILPPLHYSRQTGGKTAIQRWPPSLMTRPVDLWAEASLNRFGCLFLNTPPQREAGWCFCAAWPPGVWPLFPRRRRSPSLSHTKPLRPLTHGLCRKSRARSPAFPTQHRSLHPSALSQRDGYTTEVDRVPALAELPCSGTLLPSQGSGW